MILIIGLGNPGVEYKDTRHNAGFLVVDELLTTKLPGGSVVAKSDVFMNDSGSFVKKLVDKYKIEPSDLYIIHDDLDIKLGEFKIQKGHGPKDHNGLNDIYQKLGSDDFWHVRIGIDNRPLDNKPMGIEYVLQNFSNEEEEILDRTVKEATKTLGKNIKAQ